MRRAEALLFFVPFTLNVKSILNFCPAARGRFSAPRTYMQNFLLNASICSLHPHFPKLPGPRCADPSAWEKSAGSLEPAHMLAIPLNANASRLRGLPLGLGCPSLRGHPYAPDCVEFGLAKAGPRERRLDKLYNI